MCNIIVLKPGQLPIKSEFQNMCWNNWHSYGLVTKIDNKLDIVKKVPESGEVDADEVYKLLERDLEFERILHVRHNTAGATNLENCHPFDVYYNQKLGRQIVFMHNGTMYDYKSKKKSQYSTQEVDDPDGPSDTKNFVDRMLTPLLTRLNGDIDDIFVQKILDKFFPMGGNKGILIGAGQCSLIFGDWKKKKDLDGNEFLSSNDDYFDTLKRGPEYDRREAARKAKLSTVKTKQEVERTVVPLGEFRLGHKHGFYQLEGTLRDINNDWNIFDRDTAVALGYATRDELADIYKAGEEKVVYLMDWMFAEYATLYGELLEAQEDKKKGELVIASLKKELEKEKKVG
jgi:hypothetical protein